MTSKKSRALEVNKHRDLLIHSIRAHLLPAIANHGFRLESHAQHGLTDREFVLSFPFDHLVRAKGTGIDLVEIQLAPYRRSAFRINAGIAPKEGMMTLTGHWQQVCVGWLNESFEMYASEWRRNVVFAGILATPNANTAGL